MPKRSLEAPASKDNPKTRRCRNCPKMFTTIREYQHFCSARCRWEFHHYNNTGFGRVKHLVEKMLGTQDAQIARLNDRLTALEARVEAGFKAGLPQVPGMRFMLTDDPRQP